MILRPLAKIHSRGSILKIGDREIPFETREEYVNQDDDDPERERCVGPDGLEAEHETAFLEQFGIPAPWSRETGRVDGKEVMFFPGGPPDAMLIPVYECTLQFCNYYFRDLAQEEQERKSPGKKYTKLPLEYLTNLFDLTDKERDIIFRSMDRQMSGKGGPHDRPLPPEPTPEELSNIDELPPPELESLNDELEAHQQWDRLKQTARQKASWFSHLRQANQSQCCSHIKPDGSTCGSPAIKDKSFCYWHEQAHLHRNFSVGPLLDGADGKQLQSAGESAAAHGTSQMEAAAFEMPVLEDRLGVQLGIMRVCDLLAARSIDPYTARVMLYGLRLAQRTLGDQKSLEAEQQ